MSCMLRYDLLLRVKVHGSYTCENMKFKAFQGYSRLFHGIINFKTILVKKKHKNDAMTAPPSRLVRSTCDHGRYLQRNVYACNIHAS